MSANFRNPNFLLPNELNRKLPASGAETGSGLTEDRHSLYSMEFDGGSLINVSDKFNFVQQTGIFSVSCWIKLDNYTATDLQEILNTNNIGRLQDGWRLFYDNRGVSGSYNDKVIGFYLYGDNETASDLDLVYKDNAILDNDWHHIAVVGSPAGTYGTLTLYIDGSSVATRALLSGSLTTDTANNDLRIGDYNSNHRFDGKIDEVAIWSSDQTSNISNIYNGGSPGNIMALPNKPTAYYPLGEQARDNTEWQFPNQVLQSHVFDFDGSTDFIDVGVTPDSLVGSSNAYTVSSWVNPDISGNLNIIGSMDSGNRWYFRVLNGYASYAYGSATGDNGYNTAALTGVSLNTWSHVMFTFDGSTTHKIYINGDLKLTKSSGSGQTITSTKDLHIGALNNNGTTQNYFNGKLSNVAIWNSDQSANIANIYNYGTPQSSYTVTPTAWYKLNATNTYAGLNPNWHSALDFVAADNDYIDLGTNSSLDVFGGDFSVSLWFKHSNASGNALAMLEIAGFSDKMAMTLGFTSNTGVGFAIGSVWATNAGTGFNDGEWHHMVATRTGTTYKIYVDNVDTTITITSPTGWAYNASAPLNRIGTGYTAATKDFNGELSNIAIYNQVISAEDIKYLYNGGTPQTNISFEPTSWYKLDNLTTGIQDSGSASNNGTNNGATAVSSSVAVNQWNFNNVSQSQTPNYSSTLNFAQNKIVTTPNVFSGIVTGSNKIGICTISYWFKNDNAGAQQDYMSLNDDNVSPSNFRIDTSNRILYMSKTNYMRYPAPSDTGGWNHHCWVFNSNTSYSSGTSGQINYYDDDLKFYLNGVEQQVNYNFSAAPNNTAWNGFNIAESAQASEASLNFKMSNLSLFSSVLSSGDITTLYNNGTPQVAVSGSPVAWWKLDSTTITDSSGNGNTGTNNGATEIQTNVWTPRLNGESDTLPSTALVSSDLQFESPYSNFSLDFDGSTNYLNTNQSLNSSYTALTLSAWVNYTSISDYTGTIFGQWIQNNTGGSTIIVYTVSNKIQVYYNNSGGLGSLTSTSTLSTGAWYNVVLKFDGSTLKLYINGNEEASGALTAINNSAQNLILGAYSNSGQTGYQAHLNGKLDECAIFNKALTQSEISQVYNNGYAANLTSLSPTSWWRLGEDAYFVGNNITIPNQIANAPNGTGAGTQTSILVANAPGSYASGVGTNLDVVDRKGEAPESSANSQSINMIPGDIHPYVPGYVPAQVNNIASMAFDRAAVTQFQAGPVTFGANDFSICFWMRYNWVNSLLLKYSTFFNTQTSDSDDAFTIYTYQNKLSIYSGAESITNDASRPDIPGTSGTGLQPWTHIVLVRTASTNTWQTFANGSAYHVFPSNSASAINYQSRIIELGTNHNDSIPLDGFLDEVAVFDYALTPKQIKEDIYNASTTGKTADLNNNSNLTAPVAWYRMGD